MTLAISQTESAANVTMRRLGRAGLHDFAIPSLIYAFCFFLLTYPLIWKWRTHFYGDAIDGLQNEWNLWWFRKAIGQLHQSPWFTTWLHAPRGITLIGHTLQPLNGLIAFVLGFVLPRVQVYNVIILGGFVFSGVTAFWLSRHVVKLYVPSLIGGFAFTFTGFHFAQARGHMQFVTVEFLPLFLHAWLKMLEAPSFRRAAISAFVLGLVLFCDFYLAFYCVVAGVIFGFFYAAHLNRIFRAHPASFLPFRFGVFAAVSMVCCAPLAIALIVANRQDAFARTHDPAIYSADVFSPLVPGGADLLGRYTRSYWSVLTTDPSEESVYIGMTVFLMALYGIANRRQVNASVAVWVVLAVVSYALSLGPLLHVYGVRETSEIMPYAWLEALLPFLKLGGCPSRISVLLALAVSVLASVGAAALWQRQHWGPKTAIALFAVAMAVDLWPTPFFTTRAICPSWTTALRDLPLKGAVIAAVYDNPGAEMYCQTLYDRPMAFGYIFRMPKSVVANDARILSYSRNGNFAALRSEMGFVYLVIRKNMDVPGLPVVYADDTVVIRELPDGRLPTSAKKVR